MFPRLSIRSRLILMLLAISGLAAITLIVVGRQHGNAAMEAAAEAQLSTLRSNKKYQIENYFRHQFDLVESLGESPAIRDALRQFKRGFRNLTDDAINAECTARLNDHYARFVARLGQNMAVKPDIDLFYPTTVAGCYLQFEYLVDNPHPVGAKDKLDDANDNSYYSETHRRFHPYLRKVQRELGFYDLFLIDLEGGDVVYSVSKETDFATNLQSGPYRESNLAQLTRELRINRDLSTAALVDYAHYRPSYGAPAAFLGIPVVDGAQTLGALVVQLPIDEIDAVMTGNQNWTADGLGTTGETYLVGEDFLMRSTSRFFLEDSTGYRASQLRLGVSDEALDREFRLGTTILEQRVRTEAVEAALREETDVRRVDDYRGEPVLSAFTPLDVPGLEWVLLSEIDTREALATVRSFERKMFIPFCLLMLIVTFLTVLATGAFIKPVEMMTEAVRRVQAGDFSARIHIPTAGEFQNLGNSFNALVESTERHEREIADFAAENERLLLNFIPADLVQRLRDGQQNIADEYGNVSLITIDLVGFSDLTQHHSPLESIALLNQITDAFDDAADRHFVEKIHTVGDTYFAACGMFHPRLDHAKRLVDYAIDARQILRQFNVNNRLELNLQISIHTGPVVAGIVGHNHFSFDLIGSTVTTTFHLGELHATGDILLTDEAYRRTLDFFNFERLPSDGEPRRVAGDIWRVLGRK